MDYLAKARSVTFSLINPINDSFEIVKLRANPLP